MQPIIALRGVTKRFREKTILSNLNLDIPRGVFAAITGPNGSGKTTLIKAILGLLDVEGTIKINGEELSDFKDWDKISYVPQRAFKDHDLHLTVEDILSTSADQPRSVAEEHRLTEIYHKRFPSLSGGQQQRVLMALSTAKNPEILILDEPLAGVDTASRDQFYEALQHLNDSGVTILFVTHDIHQAAGFTHQICVHNTTCELGGIHTHD